MESQWCFLWASPIQNIVVACLFVVSLAPQLYVVTAWQSPLDDTARLFTDVAFSTVLVAHSGGHCGGSCGGSREYQATADGSGMFPDAGTHAIYAMTGVDSRTVLAVVVVADGIVARRADRGG